MANPTILTVPTILQVAPLAGGFAAKDRAVSKLNGGAIEPLLPDKIFFVWKRVQNRYDKDPTDTSLRATANTLWTLLGKYGLQALDSLGQGGGEVIIVPTGSAGTVISIQGQIVELVVGDPSQANPTGAPTPNDGDTTVTLNFKVMPNTENIFYNGVPVKLYPDTDFWYVPIYGATTTTYTFRDPLTDGFALKFDFMKITNQSSGGTGVGNGLQAVYVTATTTSNTLTVDELGTFMFMSLRNQSWDASTPITQTGTSLDLTAIGGINAGEVALIFYYPSLLT